MFSDSLKELIEASLVDGVLTGEERNIIIKRALLEGNDPAEVNLLLDAEVQKIRQQKMANAPKVNKCPACGEILPPLTGICPTCGYVVNTNDSRNQELDFLIEQMNRGLAQLKSGTTNAPMVIATLDEHRRRAMTLYGENPKVQALLAEIKEEVNEFKAQEAERKKMETEMQREEHQARIQALKGAGGGGSSLSYENNKGCYKGCLISVIIFIVLGIVGAIFDDNNDDEKTDQQYATLIEQLDSLKAEPLTIENYAQKESAAKDVIWVVNNEYSSYEKNKKAAFEKIYDNYVEQLSTFYALHNKEIDKYNGYVLHKLE